MSIVVATTLPPRGEKSRYAFANFIRLMSHQLESEPKQALAANADRDMKCSVPETVGCLHNEVATGSEMSMARSIERKEP